VAVTIWAAMTPSAHPPRLRVLRQQSIEVIEQQAVESDGKAGKAYRRENADVDAGYGGAA
jgi:hypothetical protein